MRRDLIAAALGGAIAIVLAGGVAWAAIGDGGVIQGCYDSGGNLKVVAALPCPKGYTPLPWNQQGPPGTPGAIGGTGPAGVKGDKGDPCLPSDPACVGPQGDKGDKGDQGPPGSGGGSAPVGTVVSYAGSAAPQGWLVADGSEVSRSTYSELFAAIGTTYGAGNGSSTFTLPDLRGRVVVAVGSQHGRGDARPERRGRRALAVTAAHPLGARTLAQRRNACCRVWRWSEPKHPGRTHIGGGMRIGFQRTAQPTVPNGSMGTGEHPNARGRGLQRPERECDCSGAHARSERSSRRHSRSRRRPAHDIRQRRAELHRADLHHPSRLKAGVTLEPRGGRPERAPSGLRVVDRRSAANTRFPGMPTFSSNTTGFGPALLKITIS